MKKRLRELLCQAEFDRIDELSGGPRRVLGLLVTLTYDPDPLIAWRAVEAMGHVAERVAKQDPGCVREHLRRLFWLITEESGGICWRAPEAMAEIVARTPERFGDYIPIVISLLSEMADEDLQHFRPGILWAIGRLGPLARADLDPALASIVAALDHADAQVRGLAAWCLGQVGYAELLAEREDLLKDRDTLDLYGNGLLRLTHVRDVVRAALADQAADA